ARKTASATRPYRCPSGVSSSPASGSSQAAGDSPACSPTSSPAWRAPATIRPADQPSAAPASPSTTHDHPSAVQPAEAPGADASDGPTTGSTTALNSAASSRRNRPPSPGVASAGAVHARPSTRASTSDRTPAWASSQPRSLDPMRMVPLDEEKRGTTKGDEK